MWGHFNEFSLCSIPEIFSRLDESVIEAAVVPLMNSTDGVYRETAEGLLKCDAVQQGSLDLKIGLAIGIHSASSREQITCVRSRGSALRECARYLDTHFSWVAREEAESTAQVMKEIRDQKLFHVAAVGGAFGMKRYGLKILDVNIEDQADNFTTFLYLRRK